MKYPRPGEPIVPRLLRPLVRERHTAPFTMDWDGELIGRDDLGADAWERLPPDACRRISLLVVDRVQRRLQALPEAIRDTLLPAPEAALALPLERRTINLLRAANGVRAGGGVWTVERYLSIPRFGGRALVDLVAAVESRAGVVLPTQTNAGLANDRAVHRALLAIARQVPIAESRLEIGDLRAGHRRDPLDVTALLKSAVQLGHDLSFRVIDLAGTRVVLRLRDLTAAHTAYRIAVRTVRTHGAATLDGIAGQTRTTCHTNIDAAFVEGLLSGFATFRWLDREGGWFLFVERANPLLAKVRKVLSVVTRLSLVRFAAVLARAGAGLRPSPAVVRGLCVDVPEARIKDGVVVVDRPLDRRAHLNEDETRVVRFLEASGGAMTDAQLRWRVRQIGLAWTPVWRLLHSSPLFERPSHGMFRLVGSG